LTEARDRGENFQNYQWIRSLREFVLITQHQFLVEHFRRRPSEPEWTLKTFSGQDAIVEFPALECRVAMAEIYRNVDFEAAERPSRAGASFAE
jgi:Uma2 family endonuclease